MKEQKQNRTEHLHVRFTPKEFEKISSGFSKSACRKLSDYVRKILLEKPIKINQRNQSLDDFMAELITLRNELNALGNNYNQVVKRLHTMTDSAELKAWLLLNESAKKMMLEKVQQIKSKIYSINDIWLQ
ncbi:MAG: plasmid mobilization relaxosome protein MobC [Chryseobacterium sp.]|nr:MAG: plasmid mobilization relaxosome protein MobC [Chryseobacterium sp.]